MSDNYDPVNLPVTQIGVVGDSLGSPITRQAGIAPETAPETAPVTDPVKLPPIVQPGDGTEVRRNVGPAQFYGADGVLYVDRPVSGETVFVDGPFSEQQLPPPGIERTAMALPPRSEFGEMTAVQQRAAIKAQAEALGFVVSDAPGGPVPPVAGDVIASDQPGDAHDPRDPDSKPQVITSLPVIKKAPIVPVVVSDQAAPKAKKGKK